MASKINKGEILAKFFDDGEYTALFADGAVSAACGYAAGQQAYAVYQNGAAVTAERTVEDPEQGGLARTGGTDHRYKIPLADGKAGISQGMGAVLKFFTDMLNFQQHK